MLYNKRSTINNYQGWRGVNSFALLACEIHILFFSLLFDPKTNIIYKIHARILIFWFCSRPKNCYWRILFFECPYKYIIKYICKYFSLDGSSKKWQLYLHFLALHSINILKYRSPGKKYSMRGTFTLTLMVTLL